MICKELAGARSTFGGLCWQREVELAEREMPTNVKETKGAGKALINALGFVSFLFGSLVLLAIVFGMIGSIFMSTKRLFQVKQTKKDEDNTHSEPERGREVR